MKNTKNEKKHFQPYAGTPKFLLSSDRIDKADILTWFSTELGKGSFCNLHHVENRTSIAPKFIQHLRLCHSRNILFSFNVIACISVAPFQVGVLINRWSQKFECHPSGVIKWVKPSHLAKKISKIGHKKLNHSKNWNGHFHHFRALVENSSIFIRDCPNIK